MATKKVIARKCVVKKTPAKKSVEKKSCTKRSSSAKRCCTTRTSTHSAATTRSKGKKSASVKNVESQRTLSVTPKRLSINSFDSKRAAARIELENKGDSTITVEALKIGLLLAAIDGHCDENELQKFKAVAESCGGFSDSKISQIISQTQRRISSLEEASKAGATDDEIVDKFIAEAQGVGIGAECRNFVLWMSIAMVDGDYSRVERMAIQRLQEYANKRGSYLTPIFGRRNHHEVSDIFLKRCEMILSGIYRADADGDKAMAKNRMKSLQTLVEITEA